MNQYDRKATDQPEVYAVGYRRSAAVGISGKIEVSILCGR